MFLKSRYVTAIVMIAGVFSLAVWGRTLAASKNCMGVLLFMVAIGLVISGKSPARAGTISFADLQNDGSLFGTGVYFDHLDFLGHSQMPPIQDVNQTIANKSDSRGDRQGRAEATSVIFDLGAQSVARNRNYVQAGAAAATGFTIFGDTGEEVPGSITLHGNFIQIPDVSGNSVHLIVTDYVHFGFTLAEIFLNSESTDHGTRPPIFGDAVSYSVLQPNTALFDQEFGGGISGIDWSGSITVPIKIPSIAHNGLIVELFTEAISGNGEEVQTNFLDTFSLTLDPPPGETVRFATGETFGSAVPEPCSLTLFAAGGFGLFAHGWWRRRRARSKDSRFRPRKSSLP